MESHAHRPLYGAPPTSPGGVTGSVAGIEERFDDLVQDFREAVTDPVAAHRLKSYDLSACITVEGAEHLELWCTLNGSSRIDTQGDGRPADLTVTIAPEVLDDFWDRHLALEILRKRATSTGQVRRLLTIMPVLRAAVRRRDEEDGQ